MLLFLTTKIAVVTSRANQQQRKEREKEKIKSRIYFAYILLSKSRPMYSVRESRFRNQGNFCLWNPEYRSTNPEYH